MVEEYHSCRPVPTVDRPQKLRGYLGHPTQSPMRVAVEVCVTSLAEALAAERAGADSVEVCSWLAAGGITPSAGLVEAVRANCRISMRVLVRPTGGGFRYAPTDRTVMLAEVRALAASMPETRAVIGALDAAGAPDTVYLQEARALLPKAELTFHRAMDHAADPLVAVRTCRQAGLQRVLTSGGRSLAIDGADILRAMVQQAGPDMIIAAAGGIGPANVVEVVERSGVWEVHFAAQLRTPVNAGPALSSAGQAPLEEVAPDERKIEGVLNALVKAGLR